MQARSNPDFALPWGVRISDKSGILELAEVGKGFVLRAEKSGNYSFSFNLLGIIPLKEMQVNVIPPIELVPSGHSIGVRLSEYGVVIAGLDSVQTNAGEVSPARDSGFRVGDILVGVNGIEFKSLEHAAAVLEEQSQPGRELQCEVVRKGERIVIKVAPVYDEVAKKNRLGLLLRDTAAGVGTMTFYHPETGIFGALGHMITDESAATRRSQFRQHCRCQDNLDSPRTAGKPGEKKGAFSDHDQALGKIYANTALGIFGKLAREPEGEAQSLPLGFKHQVKTGKAEILTVIEGSKIERFTIEIEKVFVQNRPASKGMVVRITDPRLLAATGGIVQGMSGSPIIQNGKLIGAITHVFINEPTRGYGCFAEWMVTESGLLEEIESMTPPGYWRYFFAKIDNWRRDSNKDVEI